jgi:Spy/CpxP family protein refolding chaperone
MKAEYKNKWMIWVIAALVLLNISTLITVVYHNKHTLVTEAGITADSVKSENTSVLYSGRYFRDELNLTEEQMDKFSQFNPVFRQAARAINIKLSEIRHEMLVEMAGKISDENKLNHLSDSIGYLHASLKKTTYRYYLSFKNICTPEQQQKLEQLFGEMFSNDTQVLQNRSGGQKGRGFGWRNRN